jgi:PAS domain S-box-containing protein
MFPKRFEEKLIGSRSLFSMEQRVYHALCIVVMGMLFSFFFLNLYLNLFESRLIIVLTFIAQCILFYQSRYKNRFTLAIILNAIMSYMAIGITFLISSGIDGPNIFLFFMTFALLIGITPSRMHKLWAILHIAVVLTLINFQYLKPAALPYTYETRFDRYLDTQITFLIVLVLIYFVMVYIKRHYNDEKTLAENMAHTVEQQKAVLENSEAKLRAFFNSSLSCHMLLGKHSEILDFNSAAQKYFLNKYSLNIIKGLDFVSIISPAYRELFVTNYNAALTGKTISEECLLHNGEEDVWWLFSYEPAYTYSGEIMGVSVTVTNVHERKTQQEKLVEQNQALSRIAFIQSHEIRRPVASIIGLMDIISTEGYSPSKEYLLLLEEAAKELDEKIHKIIAETNELL